MQPMSLLPPVLIGLVIGISGSLLGALVDYLNSRRKKSGFNYGGFMLVAAGIINSLAGIIAIVLSLIITGSILTALVIGLGVLIGFAVGFLVIAGVWILFIDENEAV